MRLLNIIFYTFINAKDCTTNNVNISTFRTRAITRTRTRPILTTTTTTTSLIRPTNIDIPIFMGNRATLTYFTDTTTQCFGENIPQGNAVAVNPLLLGFTEDDWNTKYKNAPTNDIPWCGKTLTLTVNGYTFTGVIIDTCSPTDTSFNDPNTGQIIGGKCDYTNVIDLYGQNGLDFLKLISNGDDFYQGLVEWSIN